MSSLVRGPPYTSFPCNSVYSVDKNPPHPFACFAYFAGEFLPDRRRLPGQIVAKAGDGELECGPADSALGPGAESALCPPVLFPAFVCDSQGLPMPHFARGCSGLILALVCAPRMLAEPTAEQLAFFESKVRPILVERCQKCHSGDQAKGELWLDSRDGAFTGGASGAAIEPGQPDASLLIGAVRYESLEMPPSAKLPDDEIAILERWVAEGAPWPAEASTRPARVADAFEITEADRAHWAFQPLRPPTIPTVQDAAWQENPIDAFVRAKLNERGIAPNARAGRRELVRRAFYDLIGLPPTPEEWTRWLNEPGEDWYERLLDDLLARPQYGERWARHWLDVVRYAQSNGYERDDEKPYAWRYRDWVIQALNADLPYDRFIREQLAGDELPDASATSVIATGFYRLGVWDDEPDDKQMAEFDALDDVVSTVGAAFLGLSVGCARCHDHKFDPLPQEDYYRLLACFRNVRPYEIPEQKLESPVLTPLASAAEVAQWTTSHDEQVRAIESRMAALAAEPVENEAECAMKKAALEAELKKAREAAPPFDWALAVREHGAAPPETHVLGRGQAAQPGKSVRPGLPRIFTGEVEDLSPLAASERSTGLRRAAAEWIAAPENPLTARVLVNRVWQHHFGQGLVSTANDFGLAGTPPSDPELLDWLAARFIQDGWSIKRLHKLIMTSETYRLSSDAKNEQAAAVDPDNQLLWRQRLRRVEAEAMRDAVLAVSGELNLAMGGRGIFPRLSREVLAGQSRPGLGWELSPPEEEHRRSVYIFVKRTMLAPILEGFDYTNTAQPVDARPVTTVAPQSLLMLNSRFMSEQSAALASRLRREAGDEPEALVRRAYFTVLGREPTDDELQIAQQHLAAMREALTSAPLPLTIRPEAPSSISVEYFHKLQPTDFLTGPAEGWSYGRGAWTDLGEGIITFDTARGPFVLRDGEPRGDFTFEAQVLLHANSELGSIVYRGVNRDGALRGYELRFEPVRAKVGLYRVGEDVACLAELADASPTGTWRQVKIEQAGRRHRVWLDGAAAPAMDVEDAAPLDERGAMGLRTWGSPLSVTDAYVAVGGERTRIDLAAEPAEAIAKRRALESFCLLMLNLNEFLYVD